MRLSRPLFSLILLVITLSGISTPSFSYNATFPNCNFNFTCGSVKNISYPFTGGDRPAYCGPPDFQLTCRDNDYAELTSNSVTYRVLNINQNQQTLALARSDLWNNTCPQKFINTTLNSSVFRQDFYENLTLFYGCSSSLNYTLQNRFSCSMIGANSSEALYLVGPIPFDPLLKQLASCNVLVTIPAARDAALRLASNKTTLGETLMKGFNVIYSDPYALFCSNCTGFGGQCGFDPVWNTSICICGGRLCPVDSSRSSSSNQALIALFAVGGGVLALLLLGFAIFACRKRRKRIVVRSSNFSEAKIEDIPFAPLSKSLTTTSTSYSQSTPSIPSSKYDSGKASTYFGVQVFTYTELEEATDNFNSSRELGDGGFGTVYYGKLEDGRAVAVKRLYENNFKRVEQFMNEVDILTRLRHNNLVTLYGCTSRRSRELLLVYEYIPNGTVADHLHGKRANSGLLSWPVRLSIAQETADALAYLHKSEVIHRDVKSNNILLDNDFRVKVADFGLSRLFPDNVTHVSTAPQGTPGYVDPEYYQLYHLTEKSDVYSFGVVLIELISSKQAVDTSRDRHDINLSNMAVNKIQNHELHELVDPSLGFETNGSVRRMITSVAELAFRCLQTERDMRPSMEEVLEALKSIDNEDSNAAKVDVVDIVIVDDAAPLKKNSPPISPNSVVAGNWESISTTPNNSG